MGKSKWETHVKCRLEIIKEWLCAGLPQEDIIKRLGISVDTWYRYKKKYPELSEVLTHAREKRFISLATALHDSAVGGFREEIKQEVITIDEKGRTIKLVKHKRYIPPSNSVLMSMLKRLDPELYNEEFNKIDEKSGKKKVLTDLDELERMFDE